MAQADKVFSHSIATLYDSQMGPVFFAPYAQDLARRVAAFAPKRLLETAAGSGIATEALVAALPGAEISALDLNAAMVDRARTKAALAKVKWQVGDATHMPYEDHAFDLVASQFGVMFFPDKPAAFAEARRVLKPGGHFIFSLWDALEVNPVPEAVLYALKQMFPDNSPNFMRRIPHGFFDVPGLTQMVLEAGFRKAEAEHVELPCVAPSPRHIAVALCQGTPMRSEIEAQGALSLEAVTEDVAHRLEKKFGPGPLRSTMQAILFTATN